MACSLPLANRWAWLFVATLSLAAQAEERLASQAPANWRQVAPLPDEWGLAGPVAGVVGDSLVVGGGANFPERPPWEGGTKVWHNRVWALNLAAPQARWLAAGTLPRRLGYAVCLSTPQGLVCLGGSDSERHYAEAQRFTLEKGNLVGTPLPALPFPVANACGACVGGVLYLAGGLGAPSDTKTLATFLALNLNEKTPRWRELETWPGRPRMLAVAAAHGEHFYLMSGADLSPDSDGKPRRTYLRDAFRYTPGTGWQRLADLPRAAVAAASPAPWVNGKLLVLSGDDGTRVDFQPVTAHPGFPASALRYDPQANAWSEGEPVPAPRVTLPCVPWREAFVLPSGEVRPGVRSPQVWIFQPHPE